MSRWAAKHELEPAEVAALAAEIDHLQELQNRFAQPFVKDHSQDAEPDNDAEEDDMEASPSI